MRIRAWACLMKPDETARSACAHLLAALRYYRSLGVRIEHVMTGNGAAYRSRRFARLLRRPKLRHIRTRPYTPRTHGKAGRFIQTALREWAYAYCHPTSEHRARSGRHGCIITTSIGRTQQPTTCLTLRASALTGTRC